MTIEELRDFLNVNKVSFEQLIRCFNLWDRLSSKDRNKFINSYEKGTLNGFGSYPKFKKAKK
jgi:hypothetical protein